MNNRYKNIEVLNNDGKFFLIGDADCQLNVLREMYRNYNCNILDKTEVYYIKLGTEDLPYETFLEAYNNMGDSIWEYASQFSTIELTI